jgi:2,3-bisphosphoglycerate-independent phosphoglycerate mutase
MMRLLFLFLDGVGLGADDPEINPFRRAAMPTMELLLEGKSLVASSVPYMGTRASLLALDACLGVPGVPQSATGQATLLTGRNVPAAIGYHYGPKPNQEIAHYLKNGNIFNSLEKNGKRATFLNAYPQRYFEGISSGKRIYSAIPLAVTSAGIALKTEYDLFQGNALAADFTAQGWRDVLHMPDTPVITPFQAGERLAVLAQDVELAFFEYWLSDYAGHHQDMAQAVTLLESFDSMLAGLLQSWNDAEGLILITSDHGNLEDLSTRRHTQNPVPALIIGKPEHRQRFSAGLTSLTNVTPAILQWIASQGEKLD